MEMRPRGRMAARLRRSSRVLGRRWNAVAFMKKVEVSWRKVRRAAHAASARVEWAGGVGGGEDGAEDGEAGQEANRE